MTTLSIMMCRADHSVPVCVINHVVRTVEPRAAITQSCVHEPAIQCYVLGPGDAAEHPGGGLCHGAILQKGAGGAGRAKIGWRPGCSTFPCQVRCIHSVKLPILRQWNPNPSPRVPTAMQFLAIFGVCRWPPSALGGQPGAVPLAQRLLRQGLQLGLVGLLTGLAGSAVAHQLTHWQRQKAAQGRRPPEQADAADAGVSGAGGCPGADEERPQWLRVPTDVALQRMLFMAVSANMRHAALYAAEDRLGVYAGGPARLWAVRGLLHVANSLLAAVQWRHMSHSIYPS